MQLINQKYPYLIVLFVINIGKLGLAYSCEFFMILLSADFSKYFFKNSFGIISNSLDHDQPQ